MYRQLTEEEIQKSNEYQRIELRKMQLKQPYNYTNQIGKEKSKIKEKDKKNVNYVAKD